MTANTRRTRTAANTPVTTDDTNPATTNPNGTDMTDTTTNPAPVAVPDATTTTVDPAAVAAIVAAMFGDVTNVDPAAPVDVTAYAAADRSNRAAIRTAVAAARDASIPTGDMMTAWASAGDMTAMVAAGMVTARWSTVDTAMGAATTARTAAPAVIDWAGLHTNRVTAAVAAAVAIVTGDVTIDGAPDDYAMTVDHGDVAAYIAAVVSSVMTDRDAVMSAGADVPDYVDTAAAIAGARATRRRPTNDVAAAIRDAFRGAPVGTTMTVADVRRAWVANGGPTNADGRIRARVYAATGCTVAGIAPVIGSIPAAITNTAVIDD